MDTREQRLAKFREGTKNVTKATTVLLWIFGITTIGLFVASFLVPPRGEIDPSILRAAGILFAFATLAEAREAIREGLGIRLTHGHTTLEVHDLDGPEPEHHPGHPNPHEHYIPEDEND